MIVLGMVNLLLSLAGILPGLRRKSWTTNRPEDSAADQARIEQLTEVVQKG
ncbi:MAG TPA: hypothetical protein VNZ03_34460 [Terriglobales bacterium]|jgi:hypothetical protein|nr:hypothetical protein [Terriglobales bacterium]